MGERKRTLEDLERLRMSEMIQITNDMSDFYRGKRVLVTGHTGFKGSWLTRILLMCGANVTGYSLNPPTEPSLFEISGIENKITNVFDDVRNRGQLKKAFDLSHPEIVFHLAAQPIVRTSYERPVETFETNVLGTVNLLECIRTGNSVKSAVNITTDKVYRNEDGRDSAFTEDEFLMGWDPYSNSKSCSELVTYSYVHSFDMKGISTVRAGNVIGGGDFAKDRLVPDCYRALAQNEPIVIRNPKAIRPFQHVLEPVCAYLKIAMMQYENPELAGNYNIGPAEEDCLNAEKLAGLFCREWGSEASYVIRGDGGPHEAAFLKLNCEKIRNTFGIEPKLTISDAVAMTAQWYKEYTKEGPEAANSLMDRQIKEYLTNV